MVEKVFIFRRDETRQGNDDWIDTARLKVCVLCSVFCVCVCVVGAKLISPSLSLCCACLGMQDKKKEKGERL